MSEQEKNTEQASTSAVQGIKENIHENLKKNTKNYSRKNIRIPLHMSFRKEIHLPECTFQSWCRKFWIF